MDPVTLAFILAMVELIGKYGVPAATEIIAAWKKDNITLADIQALRDMVPPPETYFKDE